MDRTFAMQTVSPITSGRGRRGMCLARTVFRQENETARRDGPNGKDAAMTPGHDYSTVNATHHYRDNPTRPNTNAEQVLAGTTVFDANGEQLGTGSERGFEN